MPLSSAVRQLLFTGRVGSFRTLVTDTFTRVDTTGPLGTADSGQAWETIAGTAFGITSNQAYNTDTANTLCIATIDSATCNGRVSCSVTRTTQVAGLVFRLSDASNYWYVSLSGSSTTLNKMVAGSPTTVATTASTFSGATSVEAVMSGSSLTVTLNGVALLTASDSFNSTATKHGIFRQQTVNNSRHDTFTVRQSATDAAPLTRAEFLSQASSLLGANQRIIYTPNNTDTTTSVESSTVGRTITWDGDRSGRVGVLGNGYYQTFNGTTQYGEMPDANDLSFGNGTADSAFSVLALINPSAMAAECTVLAKFAAATYEWRCVIDSGGLIRFYLYDHSASVQAQARSLGVLTAGQWALVGYTFTAATGGATAADSMYVYANGTDRTSVRVNNASYVAMENGTALGSIGAWESHTFAFFPGSMGFVALTQKALTASEHAQAATLCRRTFGVPL